MKNLLTLFLLVPLFSFSQFLHIGEWNGLVGNDVLIVKGDMYDNLWVGTGGGLSRINPQGITNFNNTNGLLSNAVTALEIDNFGNVWVGSSLGLSVYDGVSWNHVVFGTFTQANVINDIEVAANGNVWIATPFGLRVFDGSNYLSYTVAHGLPHNFIKSLSKDDQGHMWIGTVLGLCQYDGSSFTTYNTTDGLSSNNVKSLYASDKVYAYMSEGLNVFDGISFELYTGLGPQLNSLPRNIFDDEAGNIWMCFEKEIVKYNNAFERIVTINQDNATIPDEGYTYACFAGDTFCLATYDGFFYTEQDWLLPENLNYHADTINVNHFACTVYQTGNGDEDFWNRHQSLWIGGMDQDNTFHMATGKYGRVYYSFVHPNILYADLFENWSVGPIGTDLSTIDQVGEWHYPRKVYQSEIDHHIANWSSVGYTVPESIEAWPEEGEYYDNNSNNFYDPENGDYPIIRGDVAVLSIYNDALYDLDVREPMEVEVHALTYAFETSGDSALSNTYFINYKIKNKSINDYSSVHVGIFKDFDLGGFLDDYLGTDSVKNMIYAYNSDNDDDIYPTGEIPAMGISILNTQMTSSIYFGLTSNGFLPEMTGPDSFTGYYNYLSGYWKDGTPITYGGIGYGGDTPVDYIFTGDPLSGSGWTALGENLDPIDARNISIVGPFDLAQGEEICLDIAVTKATAWGSTNLMSVKELQGRSYQLQSWYQHQSFTCDSIITESVGNFSLYAQDLAICENDLENIQLNAIRVGGTYPFSYQWTDENNSFTESFHSPYVSRPLVTTDYYVTVTDAMGNVLTDTLTVTVNELPVLDLGNDTLICVGETLTIDAGMYDSYHWNTGINTSSHVINDAGTYSLTVTDEACEVEDEIAVSYSIPDIGLSDITYACEGESLTLAVNSFPSIMWETLEQSSQISIDPSLYELDYLSVSVLDSLGCARTDSTLILLSSTPIINLGNDTSILDTQNIVLNAYVSTGASYQWYNGSNDSIITFYGSQGEGVYDVWVQATDINGCETLEGIVITVDFYTHINEQANITIELYPNPVSEVLNVETSSPKKYHYQLMDELSKEVKKGFVYGGKNSILVEGLAKGIYFIVIEDLNFTKKLIIE